MSFHDISIISLSLPLTLFSLSLSLSLSRASSLVLLCCAFEVSKDDWIALIHCSSSSLLRWLILEFFSVFPSPFPQEFEARRHGRAHGRSFSFHHVQSLVELLMSVTTSSPLRGEGAVCTYTSSSSITSPDWRTHFLVPFPAPQRQVLLLSPAGLPSRDEKRRQQSREYADTM